MKQKRRRTARMGGGGALSPEKAAEETPPGPGKRGEPVLVDRWCGPVDAERLNDQLLEFIRYRDQHCHLPDAELARRMGITRQRLDKLHQEMKVLTVPMLAHWCNGHHIDSTYLMALFEKAIRDASSNKRANQRQP